MQHDTKTRYYMCPRPTSLMKPAYQKHLVLAMLTSFKGILIKLDEKGVPHAWMTALEFRNNWSANQPEFRNLSTSPLMDLGLTIDHEGIHLNGKFVFDWDIKQSGLRSEELTAGYAYDITKCYALMKDVNWFHGLKPSSMAHARYTLARPDLEPPALIFNEGIKDFPSLYAAIHEGMFPARKFHYNWNIMGVMTVDTQLTENCFVYRDSKGDLHEFKFSGNRLRDKKGNTVAIISYDTDKVTCINVPNCGFRIGFHKNNIQTIAEDYEVNKYFTMRALGRNTQHNEKVYICTDGTEGDLNKYTSDKTESKFKSYHQTPESAAMSTEQNKPVFKSYQSQNAFQSHHSAFSEMGNAKVSQEKSDMNTVNPTSGVNLDKEPQMLHNPKVLSGHNTTTSEYTYDSKIVGVLMFLLNNPETRKALSEVEIRKIGDTFVLKVAESTIKVKDLYIEHGGFIFTNNDIRYQFEEDLTPFVLGTYDAEKVTEWDYSYKRTLLDELESSEEIRRVCEVSKLKYVLKFVDTKHEEFFTKNMKSCFDDAEVSERLNAMVTELLENPNAVVTNNDTIIEVGRTRNGVCLLNTDTLELIVRRNGFAGVIGTFQVRHRTDKLTCNVVTNWFANAL